MRRPSKLSLPGMLLLALLPAMAAAQQAQTRRALEADARAAARPLPAATSPLGLDEVLAASRFHAPQVLEALARVRGAEARVTTTEGAFDTLFNANVEARPTGFYDGAETGFRITQPFANNGGNFYGGYDVSRGSFSSSQSSNNTAQAGRITVGTMFALLRDREIDERRFNRAIASGDVVLADNDRLLVAIGVQARAIAAYNNWVIAGQRVTCIPDCHGKLARCGPDR